MKTTILAWTDESWDEYQYWLNNDLKMLKRINDLIEATKRNPFKGIGKPEKLKFGSGYWSRRINIEHRLVYKVSGDILYIAQCRYHYQK